MYDDDPSEVTILDKVMRLQNGLLAHATGGAFEGGDATFQRLRRELLGQPELRGSLPTFLRQCRDLAQFWQFIKHRYAHYQERRLYLWDEFRPAIEQLEANDRHPGLAPITEALAGFSAEAVQSAWQKALDRRLEAPEGAITAARTLMESVCKHIIEDAGGSYGESDDLPKLYNTAAECLNLAPSQHTEQTFKAILGNCQSIVNYLGSLRNKLSDAHGQGRKPVRPKPRHAELAVNLAGAVAAFLVATWKEKA